jgi:hypothetical protein
MPADSDTADGFARVRGAQRNPRASAARCAGTRGLFSIQPSTHSSRSPLYHILSARVIATKEEEEGGHCRRVFSAHLEAESLGERAGPAPAPRTGAAPRAPGQRLRHQPPARIRRAPASRSSSRSFSASRKVFFFNFFPFPTFRTENAYMPVGVVSEDTRRTKE